VAWKNTANGHYSVWSTDGNGNFISNVVNNVSGTDASFESFETVFHQDLNDEWCDRVSPDNRDVWSTGLTQVASNYFLDPVAGEKGVTLKYGGATVVAGQFNTWCRWARRRRRADMTWPGRIRRTVIIRCGAPMAMATSYPTL